MFVGFALETEFNEATGAGCRMQQENEAGFFVAGVAIGIDGLVDSDSDPDADVS